MVLFDKGDKILKSLDFKKAPGRADLSVEECGSGSRSRRRRRGVSGMSRTTPDVVAALGDAAQHDPFWGVRVEALRALGKIGGSNAEQAIFAAVER